MAKAIAELDNSLSPFLLNDIPVFDPDKPDATNVLTTPGIPIATSISTGPGPSVGYCIACRVLRRQSVPPTAFRGAPQWTEQASVRGGVYLAALKRHGTTVAQATFSKM